MEPNLDTHVQPFLVGDSWVMGGGGTFESINPADGSIAAVVTEASLDDVDAAVQAAKQAMQTPKWRDLMAHQRAALLHRMASLVERDGDQLVELQTQDNGKTLAEGRAQVALAVEMFRYFGSLCETLESEVISPRGKYFGFSTYEPVGVVAAITPWNSPISLEAMKLAPALAAGNAVVLKSSEVTPQVGLAYGRLALEAGFPPGVLNVVTGYGQTVGQALVTHPDVGMVSFTGGTQGGRAVAKIAGERLIPVLLELGGKSPNIIFDDADLDNALTGAMFGIFHNAGQSCICGSRIFVQEAIYDRFVPRLVEAARNLVVGSPYDERTAVAPVASFPHRDRIEALIEMGRNEGAEMLCGGSRPDEPHLANGAFLNPTVLAVNDNSARIAQEEIFGPVACVLRFKDEADLIELANDTIYGLACGLWTRNYQRAFRVARRVQAGTIWINTFKITAVNMPFGGYKASGLWRESGALGMRNYMLQKSTFLSMDEGPIPWPLQSEGVI